jgi:hypothetical protein
MAGADCCKLGFGGILQMRLTDLSFAEWLDHAFGREVRFQQNPWFFDPEHDWWDPVPVKAVAYLTRLFECPDEHLHWFTDTQIAQGLTYLMSTSASGDNGWLYSREVPTEDRLLCIETNACLFEKLFLPRRTPTLSHLSEEGAALNTVCYMWWDEFPSVGLAGDPDLPTLHGSVLRSMAKILRLPSLACQESALHGLGHWRSHRPQEVETIIDGFLTERENLDPRLVAYAKAARCGCIQ